MTAVLDTKLTERRKHCDSLNDDPAVASFYDRVLSALETGATILV
jgi:hypothetical protein